MGKKILVLAGDYAEDYETMVGAQILAAAGAIRGKRISAYPACAAEVKSAGAEYAQRRLTPLRMHSVVGFEETPRKIHQHPVRRVIHGLDARDTLREVRLCLLDVVGELRLGARRSRDEDRAGSGERLRYVLQEFLVQRRVTAVARICLVMDMLVRMG